MPSEPFWWNYHGFSFFVLFVCNNHIYKVQHFICFCPLHVQVILPLFFFSLYRMHQMKLLPSYREFQIWSLATIVMGILLHLYYLIRWELRRFSMIILLFAFFMWEHIIFFPFVFFFFWCLIAFYVQCNIAHALEKTKYPESDIYWRKFEDKYHFSSQFTADLIAMNNADFIITSTYQEIAGRLDL